MEHQDFILYSISLSIVDYDITIFPQHYLGLIALEHFLGTGWPGKNIIGCLVQNTNSLFIWAAAAYRFILENKKNQVIKTRLSNIF
jgi:hypothetical protein